MEKGQENTTSLPLCQTSNHAFYTFHANIRNFREKMAASTTRRNRHSHSRQISVPTRCPACGIAFGTDLVVVDQENPGNRPGLQEKIAIPSLARSPPVSQ